ncbi:hypothetical protein [Symbiopectobacterium purcellii]|uniref:hypothetical protein n=1 Tax=Symbiopectobacterium purcellii TaxID=2871826 RepID=UPI003F82C217
MKNVSLIGKPKSGPIKQETLNTRKRESTQLVDLNFKVSPEFHRAFKIYAASNDMSMKDVLMAAFSALKEKRISGQ